MRTGVEVSKTKKKLSTIAAVTGSTVIIALAIAFVTIDFNGFMLFSPSFTVDYDATEALEPIRSGPRPEQNGSGSDSDGDGNGNSSNENGFFGDDNNNDGGQGYFDHDLPCFDPNCPIHHGDTHHIPCDDPNCPICGDHHSPCGDPDCPICNGHGLPCDDPNCPIHHGQQPPIDISMDDINFKANLAEYANQEEAETILSGYIDAFNRYFERYPEGKVYLVGCIAKTATWSFTETELSEQRAETVRQSLIDLGISENKLVSIGIGINDPWRSDEWAMGWFDEETAKLNRRVWIIPDQYESQVDLVYEIDKLINDMRD